MTKTRDLANRLDLTNIDLPKFEVPKFEVPKFDVPSIDLPKFDVPKFEVPKFEVPKTVRRKAKKARKRADAMTSSARPALPFVIAAGIGLAAVVVLRRRHASANPAGSQAHTSMPQYEPVRPVG